MVQECGRTPPSRRPAPGGGRGLTAGRIRPEMAPFATTTSGIMDFCFSASTARRAACAGRPVRMGPAPILALIALALAAGAARPARAAGTAAAPCPDRIVVAGVADQRAVIERE